jgi:hypothetical protein
VAWAALLSAWSGVLHLWQSSQSWSNSGTYSQLRATAPPLSKGQSTGWEAIGLGGGYSIDIWLAKASGRAAYCRRSQRPVSDAIGEQPIQIGKVWIPVDEEVQAFAIVLARPPAVPRLPPRIVGVEVQAAQRLPAAFLGSPNKSAAAGCTYTRSPLGHSTDCSSFSAD